MLKPVTDFPAVMTTIGEENLARIEMLTEFKKILKRYGYTVGAEFKGFRLGDWAKDSADIIVNRLGGRITYHPPEPVSFGLAETGKLTEALEAIAEDVPIFVSKYPLELVTIHGDVCQKPEEFGNVLIDCYKSQIEPGELFARILRQIPPLRIFNDRVGGILSLENTPILMHWGKLTPGVVFSIGHYTGCWLDLAYLAKEIACAITLDIAHYRESSLFLARKAEFGRLPKWSAENLSADEKRIHQLTGYYMRKNQPPFISRNIGFGRYCQITRPRHFHIEGGLHCLDKHQKIAGHILIDYSNSEMRRTMPQVFSWLLGNQCIGIVHEAMGWQPDWSRRTSDDEWVKHQSLEETVRFIQDNPQIHNI